jgi:hypothetical protein
MLTGALRDCVASLSILPAARGTSVEPRRVVCVALTLEASP